MRTLARPIGLGLAARGDVEEVVTWARQARDQGLESVWIHDSYFERDGVSFATAVAQVAIAEDPRVRLTTNIIDCDPEQLQLGQQVEVVFEQAEDVWLPLFRPIEDTEPAALPIDEIAPERFGEYVRPMLTPEKFEDKVALTGIGMSEIGRRLMPLGGGDAEAGDGVAAHVRQGGRPGRKRQRQRDDQQELGEDGAGEQQEHEQHGEPTGRPPRHRSAVADQPQPLGRLLQRQDQQYHWHNAGFADYEAYLGTFRAEKRKQIRGELKQIEDLLQ